MLTKDMTVREQVALRRAIASFCSQWNYESDLRDELVMFIRDNPKTCDAAALGMSNEHLATLAEEMGNQPWELRLREGWGDWT